MEEPWVRRATYCSSADHLKAGQGNFGGGLAPSAAVAGMSRLAKDLRGLEVSTSQMT